MYNEITLSENHVSLLKCGNKDSVQHLVIMSCSATLANTSTTVPHCFVLNSVLHHPAMPIVLQHYTLQWYKHH